MKKIFGRKNKAFSIVEIMIALVILVFGLYGILELFYNSDTTRTMSQLKTQASFVATEKLETLKSVGFDGIEAYIAKGAAQNSQNAFYPDSFQVVPKNPRLKWQAILAKSAENPNIIDITVNVLINVNQPGEVETPRGQKVRLHGVVVK